MRRIPRADTVLRLTDASAGTQWTCKSCRHLQRTASVRQIHTTPITRASEPWYRSLTANLFGKKNDQQSKEAAQEPNENSVVEAEDSQLTEIPQRRQEQRGGFDVAATIDKEFDLDYVPATSWHGLEVIGSEQWVKQQQDSGKQYEGFNPSKEVRLSEEKWDFLLHHVTVEALVARDLGKDILRIGAKRRSETLPDGTEPTNAAVLDPDTGMLSWTSEVHEQAVARSLLPQIYGKFKLPKPAPRPSSRRWLEFGLTDHLVKIAIAKRIFHLTGRRLADPILSEIKTVGALKAALLLKPTPKRLSQAPAMKKVHKNIPNVRVYATRRTPIFKEREVGRWKLIREELKERNLPVTGSYLVDARAPLPSLQHTSKKQKWTQDTKSYQVPKA